jgi:hypothetical protein
LHEVELLERVPARRVGVVDEVLAVEVEDVEAHEGEAGAGAASAAGPRYMGERPIDVDGDEVGDDREALGLGSGD